MTNQTLCVKQRKKYAGENSLNLNVRRKLITSTSNHLPFSGFVKIYSLKKGTISRKKKIRTILV